MISAHPDASSRWGADAMTAVSATTAMGGSAASETFPSAVGTEARDEAIPSCDAAVGMLMKWRSVL